jgi:hypothetical protein
MIARRYRALSEIIHIFRQDNAAFIETTRGAPTPAAVLTQNVNEPRAVALLRQ